MNYYNKQNKKHWKEVEGCLQTVFILAIAFVFIPVFPVIFLLTGEATPFEWIWFIISIIVFVAVIMSLFSASSFSNRMNELFSKKEEEK